MNVVKAAARATRTQPATNFTGTVLADEVLVGKAPSRMRATLVTFLPGGPLPGTAIRSARPCM